MDKSEFDLAWLLHPMSIDNFASQVWQKKYFLIASDRPDYFQKLFGFDQIETVLEYGQPKPPSIRLASNRHDESHQVPILPSGRLDIDRIRRLYASGQTIILNNVDDFHPAVALLAQSLQQITSYRVQANAYMTPPESQGFNPHYDTHDVLVAQIEGDKVWRIYGEEAACPLNELKDGDPFRRKDLPAPQSIALKPGDLLYIPRGWIHEAETNESASLHLTFGIHAATGRDLVQAALDALCTVRPEFRHALPFGFLHRPIDRDRLADMFHSLIGILEAEGSIDAAIDIIEDSFISLGRTPGDGQLISAVNSLPKISCRTRVMRKTHIPARLIEKEDGISLEFAQTSVEGPETFREAIEYIQRTDLPFSVEELPGLDQEEQILLAQNLVRDGYLRLVSLE